VPANVAFVTTAVAAVFVIFGAVLAYVDQWSKKR
jgi:hypothetical protein